METADKFFSFIVKTDFTQSHQRFDQAYHLSLNSEGTKSVAYYWKRNGLTIRPVTD